MRIDKIVNAFNTIQVGEDVKKRVLEKAVQTCHKKHIVLKASISIAVAAAVICFMMFGSMLLSPQHDNIFNIRAYAMEQQADGSIELREVDLLSETYYWNAYNDGDVFYINANLKCEGENISSVDFYTDDGFFAKQYLKIENGKIVQEVGVPASYRKTPDDAGYTLVMYGNGFDVIGNSFTLDKDAMTDDFLLFLGTEVSDWREVPSQMTIHAVATFNDGKTQEETLIFDLAAAESIVAVIKFPPEEIARMNAANVKRQEFQYSIPLEQCEVVADSVQILNYGSTFEYHIASEKLSSVIFFPLSKDSIDAAMSDDLFDENGIFRQGCILSDDGSDGYIAVIENNENGTFTGMVYKVPEQLIFEYFK